MLYIIGGTSRSGKSSIATSILKNANIPYLSIDWMVMGFTNGIPEYGIHDELFPDDIAKRMWNFTRAMCENIIWTGKDYVIEGEAIIPEQISELIKKYPDKVRVCFVGYTEIEVTKKMNEVKIFSEGESDWLCNKPNDYILNHINNMIKYSSKIKQECEIYNLKYFDTSYNFIGTIEQAVSYLINDTYSFLKK